MMSPRTQSARALRRLALAALLGLAPFGLRAASAATLTVTNAGDSGGGSLRDAIATANADGGGDTIVFAANLGTITLTSGLLDVTAPVTIQGGAGQAISAGNASRVFFLHGGTPAQPVTLIGLTIEDGNAGASQTSGYTTYPADGGGVETDETSNVQMTDCILTGNSAPGGSGGGVGSYGNLVMTNCLVTGNSAADGGGGITTFFGGALTLTSCTLTANTGPSYGYLGYGGGLLNDSGDAKLTDDILWGNTGGDNVIIQGNTTATYCDIGGGFGGTGNINADPHFDRDIPGYAGATPDAVQYGSPCVGAGTADAARYQPIDIRGVPRPDPPTLGAFEPLTYVVTNTGASGGGSLAAAVAAADATPGAGITFDPSVFGASRQTIVLGGTLSLTAQTAIVGPAPGVILDGGGRNTLLSVGQAADVTLTGLTLQNGSGPTGGAVDNDGTVTLTDCALLDNAAGAGGALYSDGTATLADCVLAGNSAGPGFGSSGGAIDNNGGVLTLTECTLTGNSAGRGGALYNYGTAATLTDDILWGDGATTGPEVADAAGTVAASYCDVLGGAAGTGDFSADPAFVTPYTDAASAFDLHVRPGSRAVGAGTTTAPDYQTADAAGAARSNPPTVGAYEGVATTALIALARTTGNSPSAAGQPLTFTATVTNTAAGGATPTGTVTFTYTPTNGTGGATITDGPVALDGSGQASDSPTLPAGTYSATAAFRPASPGLSGSLMIQGLSQTIVAGPAASLTVAVAGPATAGQPVSVTVTAVDQYGNTVTNYAGTATITDTDPRAAPAGPVTLTNGTATFPMTFGTAGTQTVTATAGALTGTGQIAVVSAPTGAAKVAVTAAVFPGGSPTALSVALLDSGAGAATGVHLTAARLAGVPASSLGGPVALGAGQTGTVALTFPNGLPPGAQTLLLAGTYAGPNGATGAFSATLRVSVP